jgi:hypothetical protein
MGRYVRLTTAILLLSSLPSRALAEDDAKAGAEAAKKAALEFTKAYKDRDLDALIRQSTLPWMFDFTVTIKTETELRDFLRSCIRPGNKAQQFPDTVRFVNSYADFRPKVGKEYYRKWLDELLAKDDYVVALPSKSDPNANVYIFVHYKNKKASIAGYGGD